MAPGDITCAHCGWRNESTARMCGGCGQPLRASGAPAGNALTQAVPIRSATAQTSGMPAPSMPGGVYPTTSAIPQAPYVAPYVAAQNPAAPAWPGVAQPSGSAARTGAKRSPWRIPIVLLVIVCVLLATALGTWALVIRPAVHTTVDTQLRGALDTAIEQAAPANVTIPPGQSIQVSISAAALNADINNELGNVPVKDVQVHFRGAGYVIASYTFLGRQGSIVTQLVPLANGRVEAVNTDVTGPLKLVENNDESTQAFDEALGRLPPQYHVTSITTPNDNLIVTVVGQ